MADFATPFGSQSGRRNPTADEKVNGFPCGPADQSLFNGLFYRIEAELGALISYAGLTATDSDNAQVRKAVEALISAATGGGDVSNYLLMTQARARMPIYPEVDSDDGKINITSPATGTVRVPGNIRIIHRGVYVETTEETDFNTSANKTYHVRWNPDKGLTLNDLSNAGYNPSSAAETAEAFDSTYDDMLLARVVTNSSNVSTITNLANKHILRAVGSENSPKGALTTYQWEDGVKPENITQYAAVTLNWARKPDAHLSAFNDILIYGRPTSPTTQEISVGTRALSRYAIAVWGQGDADILVGWTARA